MVYLIKKSDIIENDSESDQLIIRVVIVHVITRAFELICARANSNPLQR